MKTRAYVACSLDGFIAGPNDDLSWLPPATPKDVAGPGVGFDEFMAEVGALLMGRRTYDVVTGFDGEWPYGDRPVLVATHRPLEIATASVRPIAGEIADLVHAAKQAAGGKDVYIDGGVLIASALDAGLIDELIVTIVPVVLGDGHRLFPSLQARHAFEFTAHHTYGDMVQIQLRPKAAARAGG